MRSFKIISFLLVFSFSMLSPAYSWNTPTHSHIDESILKNGNYFGNYFDDYLKNNLGFGGEITQPVNSKTPIDWIKLGGVYEDAPL